MIGGERGRSDNVDWFQVKNRKNSGVKGNREVKHI